MSQKGTGSRGSPHRAGRESPRRYRKLYSAQPGGFCRTQCARRIAVLGFPIPNIHTRRRFAKPSMLCGLSFSPPFFDLPRPALWGLRRDPVPVLRVTSRPFCLRRHAKSVFSDWKARKKRVLRRLRKGTNPADCRFYVPLPL